MKAFALKLLASSAALVALSSAASARPVAPAAQESVRVDVSGIDLYSAAGREALNRRARAAAGAACGISPGRGAADAASSALCHENFVQAVNEAADARTAGAATRIASRR